MDKLFGQNDKGQDIKNVNKQFALEGGGIEEGESPYPLNQSVNF